MFPFFTSFKFCTQFYTVHLAHFVVCFFFFIRVKLIDCSIDWIFQSYAFIFYPHANVISYSWEHTPWKKGPKIQYSLCRAAFLYWLLLLQYFSKEKQNKTKKIESSLNRATLYLGVRFVFWWELNSDVYRVWYGLVTDIARQSNVSLSDKAVFSLPYCNYCWHGLQLRD